MHKNSRVQGLRTNERGVEENIEKEDHELLGALWDRCEVTAVILALDAEGRDRLRAQKNVTW